MQALVSVPLAPLTAESLARIASMVDAAIREKAIRDHLISLGWTPPPGGQEVPE